MTAAPALWSSLLWTHGEMTPRTNFFSNIRVFFFLSFFTMVLPRDAEDLRLKSSFTDRPYGLTSWETVVRITSVVHRHLPTRTVLVRKIKIQSTYERRIFFFNYIRKIRLNIKKM